MARAPVRAQSSARAPASVWRWGARRGARGGPGRHGGGPGAAACAETLATRASPAASAKETTTIRSSGLLADMAVLLVAVHLNGQVRRLARGLGCLRHRGTGGVEVLD